MKEKLIKIRIEDNGSVSFMGKSQTPNQIYNFGITAPLITALKSVFDNFEDWQETQEVIAKN